MYRRLGRYADAERQLNQAKDVLSPKAPFGPRVLTSLAELHRSQGRLAEAEPLYKQALEIVKGIQRGVPHRPLMIASPLMNLGICYYDMGRWQAAETQCKEALAELAGDRYANHPGKASILRNQGRLYHFWSKQSSAGADTPPDLLQKADASYQEALRIFKSNAAGNRSDIIDTLNKLAALHFDANDLPLAEKHVQEAFELLAGASRVPLEYRYNSHYVRAKIAWANDEERQAFDDMAEAIAFGVRQRARGAGGPFDRGRYYTQLMNAAERMVEWGTESAAKTQDAERKTNVAAAFRAMELTRALALQDQIALRGKDLFQGMGGAKRLKAKLLAAKAKVLDADKSLRNAAQAGQPKEEFKKLLQAKRELRDVERQIWNSSPAVRDHMAKPATVATLDQMQAWADQTESLVLEYFVGEKASYVLAIRPGDDPVLEAVNWDPEKPDAAWQRLKDLDGLLRAYSDVREAERLMGRARSDRDRKEAEQKGVQAQDQFQKWQDETDELHEWLTEFYTQLIPATVRANLAKAHPARKRIVVLPDGPLVRLPFETLVMDNNAAEREYLLDAGLPIICSPAGTMLVETAKRPATAPAVGGMDVCFVGKSNFTDHPGNWAPVSGGFGGLSSLPKGAEAGPGTFPGILGKAGLNVDVRNQDAATTEKYVAKAIQQTPIVLFSTHGLGGGESISSFGALVLSRPKAVNSLEDDGMFTYEEICECDLHACELAIHTACDTNVGPNQRGEAAWAVSRGFLVAGSRRVLATQWSAEDTASDVFSASLASQLAAQLKAQQNSNLGQLGYAGAVHEARLALRQYAGHSPVLWAPWVLIGSK